VTTTRMPGAEVLGITAAEARRTRYGAALSRVFVRDLGLHARPFETEKKRHASGNRHWLEYDSVALVVLFVGIGFVALIVLGI